MVFGLAGAIISGVRLAGTAARLPSRERAVPYERMEPPTRSRSQGSIHVIRTTRVTVPNNANQSAADDKQSRGVKWCCFFSLLVALTVTAVIVGLVMSGRKHNGSDDTQNSDYTPNSWSNGNTNYNYKPQQPQCANTDTGQVWQPHGVPSGPGSDIASEVMSVKSHSSDSHPCCNFYEYACGGWMDDNPADEYKLHNRFSKVHDEVRQILTGELSRGMASSDPSAVRKAKTLYQSCIDEARIERLGVYPVKSVISEVGGWSQMESLHGIDTIDRIVRMARYKSFPLGIVSVITDPKNSDRTIILMDQPKLPMRKLDGFREGYRKYISTVASYLGRDDLGRFSTRVNSLIDLQLRITALTTDEKDRPGTEGRYHIYKLGDLNSAFPKMDWKRVIRETISGPGVNTPLNDDEPILVENPQYFANIGTKLRYEEKRTISDYMGWAFIQEMLPFLSRELRNSRGVLLESLKVKLKEPKRSEFCTDLIDLVLANMTGRMLIDKEFDPQAVRMAKDMVKDIRKVFRETLQANQWMDTRTRSTAINKLDAMGELIAYPREIMNDTVLNLQYQDLTFSEGNFFGNFMEVIKRVRLNTLKSLHQPTSRLRWEQGPSTVNAFYDREKNIIVIPAGILRKPFFSKKFPRSMIYSRLGLIIGHEITHGFDNLGRQYDRDGNLVHWWTPSALNKYTSRAHCFQRQYSNFFYPQLSQKLNGTRTLAENIADNGGLKLAHKAYREFVSRQQKEEDDLPTLHMTHDQIFYITFSQLWCETQGEDRAKLDVDNNDVTHSPGKLRVLGSLQNNQHFTDTFKCSSGDTMDPPSKCLLW